MGTNFDNWQLSVEIDYLSMYIKTWFAFLATAKELYPSAISLKGDGSLIKEYKNNITIPFNYETRIQTYIEEVYRIGSLIIEKEFPETYFGNFYIINKNFQTSKEVSVTKRKKKNDPTTEDTLKIKISYKEKTSIVKSPNLLISFNSNSSLFYENLECYNMDCNVLISDLINQNLFTDKDKTLNFIQEEMIKKAYSIISSNTDNGIADIEERKGYSNGVILPLIQNLRPDFIVEDLFQPIPTKGFPDDYDVKKHKIKVLQWFIQFNYSLRNIMFHHVIDPFDKNWLMLFKNAYMALQEMVNHNIKTINEKAQPNAL